MSTKTEHPDYLAARDSHRWFGSLPGLFAILSRELADKKRVWRVLRSGAFVIMERHGPHNRERAILRICRTEKPKRANGAAAFQREVDTFVKWFGIEGWTREDDPDAPGIGVILREVRK